MARTKWKPEECITAADAVLELVKKDKAALEPRLQSGCVAGLTADVGQLRSGTAVATSARATKVSARMSKDELVARIGDQVMAYREALRRGRVADTVKKAAGVGKAVAAGRASLARAAAQTMLDAAAANTDAFRAAGILPADLDALRALYEALLVAENEAVNQRVAAKLSVSQRREIQDRVETAVDHIVGVAQVAFVADPAHAKLYRDVVPGSAAGKKAPVKPA
jgi:hypothetical protein